jgi:hypothetical protein
MSSVIVTEKEKFLFAERLPDENIETILEIIKSVTKMRLRIQKSCI